jgi:hypothetical protein
MHWLEFLEEYSRVESFCVLKCSWASIPWKRLEKSLVTSIARPCLWVLNWVQILTVSFCKAINYQIFSFID